MKNLARSSILLSILAFSNLVEANEGVTNLHLYQEHNGVLVIFTSMSNPDNCAGSTWYILPKTHPHYKEIYVSLLAAQLASKQIAVTTSGCYEGYPSIKHIKLSNAST